MTDMSGVNNVSLECINVEMTVLSNGIKTGKASSNEKKIEELQKTLGVNLGMLPKKHAVAIGTVFSANIAGSMSFGSKVKQFFENIKLKFWDVSKGISKDCEKLEKLLTEGVTASIRAKEKSVTGTLTKLLEGIKSFKDFSNDKFSCGDPKAQLEIERNQERTRSLANRVKTLKKFSELNSLEVFYKECDEEYNEKSNHDWQKGHFKKFNEIKKLMKSEKNRNLQSLLQNKIREIEGKILGEDKIHGFYDKFNSSNLHDANTVAEKCNGLVTKLKPMEQWLTVVDPDFQGTPFLGGSVGERYFRIHSNFPKEEPKNDAIETQLKAYLKAHPKGHIEYYRGILYIAKNGSKEPLTIPSGNVH